MNNNSFLIKGWVVVIVSAILVYSLDKSSSDYILITLPSIVCFWILDGFFLGTERNYQQLYKKVASLEESDIDFDMNAKTYGSGAYWWLSAMFSRTFIVYYVFLIAIVLALSFTGSSSPLKKQNELKRSEHSAPVTEIKTK